MNKDLLKVSIRQNAIYLPLIEEEKKQEELTSTTIALVAQLRKVGYSLSEELPIYPLWIMNVYIFCNIPFLLFFLFSL